MNANDLFLMVPVLAAMAAIAVNDARHMTIEPGHVALLLSAGLLWLLLASDGAATPGSAGEALAGAAIGAAIVAIPIAIAHRRRRKWPIFPGDAMMFGAFGAVLGPLGLGWALLLGSLLALAYRILLQRRRGRPVCRGYCPLGPGMAAGAMVVFIGLNAGIVEAGGLSKAAASGADPAHAGAVAGRADAPGADAPESQTPGGDRIPATRLTPVPSHALPAHLATKELALREERPATLAALAGRLSELAAAPVEIEDRPPRIAGGAVDLPAPAPFRLQFRGTLPALLDRIATRTGYAWEWRDDAIVFFRYRDAEQETGATESGPWTVDPDVHGTVEDVLREWAARAGWSVVWTARQAFSVNAEARMEGTFLGAVDLLLAAPATRRALVATAHRANRHLVVGDAGTAP